MTHIKCEKCGELLGVYDLCWSFKCTTWDYANRVMNDIQLSKAVEEKFTRLKNGNYEKELKSDEFKCGVCNKILNLHPLAMMNPLTWSYYKDCTKHNEDLCFIRGD